VNFTYTPKWSHRKPNLIPVPKDPSERVVLLERAVCDLVIAIMEDKGWDNPLSVVDACLSDECVRMAQWALERYGRSE
jgi:hypothetical protein